MAFSSLPVKLQDDPIDVDYLANIKANFDALNGEIGTVAGADITNGSFEIDSDGDGWPDSWVETKYPGGYGGINTTVPAHGAACLEMIHPGGASNGGLTATSDYVACSEINPVVLQMIHWASAAGMKNQVIFYWYTSAKVACATASTTVYDSAANPTNPTLLILAATPPATARYYKLKLVGGESSVNVAGSAYWDNIKKPDHNLYTPTMSALVSGATSSTTYVDLATITLSKAGFNCRVLVIVHISFEGSGSGTDREGGARLRVGATSGDADKFISTYSTADGVQTLYTGSTLVLDVPSLPIGSIIYLQGRGVTSVYTSTIRIKKGGVSINPNYGM